MRLSAALLLFLLCAFAGNEKAAALERRCALLAGLCDDIGEMALLMRHRAMPLPSVLERLSRGTGAALWNAFSRELSGGAQCAVSFAAALETACATDASFMTLSVDDRRALTDFGTELGRGDMAVQEGNIRLVTARLEQRASTLRSELYAKGYMYRSLGVMLGLAASLTVW